MCYDAQYIATGQDKAWAIKMLSSFNNFFTQNTSQLFQRNHNFTRI